MESSGEIEVYCRTQGVSLYCGCLLYRKSSMENRMTRKRNFQNEDRGGGASHARSRLFLRLTRKEASSSYSKDDLWIVGKTLHFSPGSAFLARSVFYGPTSGCELEIDPISGYSPSNWSNNMSVHVIHSSNASTEMACLRNIQDNVSLATMPVLPSILNSGDELATSMGSKQRRSSFIPPSRTAPSSGASGLDLPDSVMREVAQRFIDSYGLNDDQGAALMQIVGMLGSEATSSVCLIHGVFGAGKSYLLSVAVLLLNELFTLSGCSNWRLLVSSMTNVAVDRILLGLVSLGFEDFVRVGSLRKMAKPLLPYSVMAASGGENQQLRELQEMLKGDLIPSEKFYVRRSIEAVRLGVNQQRLGRVKVVGVTCAACTFPCMAAMKFAVVLLDECSQMTEPLSLLPIAPFHCRKLVLVGDPKQLAPTVQGTKGDLDDDLQQTLFDRLMKLDYSPVMLRTQYRCHPHISAIANDLFYDGCLRDGVTYTERAPLMEWLPTLCFYNVSHGSECVSRHGSYYNNAEVAFIMALIESLLASGTEPTAIGVITLYKAQASAINTAFQQSKVLEASARRSVQVSTVDAFQGGEKDVILLSCVRTKNVGFIDCKRRTNVALTRAKHHLVIIGSDSVLSQNPLWSSVLRHCKGYPRGFQSASIALASIREVSKKET